MKFSLTWDPMGVKISKRYSFYSFESFSTKLFLNVPCNNPHKTCFLEFWNFKFKLFKKRLKFNIVANGKMQNCQYLGNSQPHSKTKWNLGLGEGGSLGNICATSGSLANGQVSCPDMASLKIGLYLRNHFS